MQHILADERSKGITLTFTYVSDGKDGPRKTPLALILKPSKPGKPVKGVRLRVWADDNFHAEVAPWVGSSDSGAYLMKFPDEFIPHLQNAKRIAFQLGDATPWETPQAFVNGEARIFFGVLK